MIQITRTSHGKAAGPDSLSITGVTALVFIAFSLLDFCSKADPQPTLDHKRDIEVGDVKPKPMPIDKLAPPDAAVPPTKTSSEVNHTAQRPGKVHRCLQMSVPLPDQTQADFRRIT